MTMTKNIKHSVPFFILFALLFLLWWELFHAHAQEIPSALVGEPVPQFELADILHADKPFTAEDLNGKVSLLNVWATWCYACNIEAPMLMRIKEKYHVPIYSIDYKDAANLAQQWLQKYGNPYTKIGMDKHGDVAIDLGVYGTPETFVISPNGKIVYRHVGVIDQKTWDEILYPLVKKYAVKN